MRASPFVGIKTAAAVIFIFAALVLWKAMAFRTLNPFQPAHQFSISAAAVPRQGQLKSVQISKATRQQMISAHGDRTSLLNEVIRLSPDAFPPKARVLSVRQNEWMMPTRRPRGWVPSYFVIDLNKAFDNPSFWRRAGRRNTKAAFHALASNVAFQNVPKGGALPIRFHIEQWMAIETEGFDATQLLHPQKIMKMQ